MQCLRLKWNLSYSATYPFNKPTAHSYTDREIYLDHIVKVGVHNIAVRK